MPVGEPLWSSGEDSETAGRRLQFRVRRAPASGLGGALLAALALATAAVAATITGTKGADVLRGTAKADVLYGREGNDTIYGLAGNDRIYTGPGKDRVFCGAGTDRVQGDRLDIVAKDCELVRRPLPAPPPPAPPTPTPPPPAPAPPVPAQPPEVGTRARPYPLGAVAALDDDWRLWVESAVPDATAIVLAYNRFNAPPVAGNQFFIARVTATYVGTFFKLFDGPFRLRVVGATGSYTAFENTCGVIPDQLSEADVFTGGTITGNVCWQIRSSDAASLLLYDTSPVSDKQTFFALP